MVKTKSFKGNQNINAIYRNVGRVYGAQSWKERTLLCESMFAPIGKQTLISKKGRMKSFSYETKASI